MSLTKIIFVTWDVKDSTRYQITHKMTVLIAIGGNTDIWINEMTGVSSLTIEFLKWRIEGLVSVSVAGVISGHFIST